MAEQNRRIGCGCLPLVLVLLVGSALLQATDVPEPWAALFIPVIFGVAVVAAIVAAVQRRRRSEAQDRVDDGQPSATGSDQSPHPPAPASPPTRPSRGPELTAGPPQEDLATSNLRRELREAVEDLQGQVEGKPNRRLTSEEMIARAKRRLADFNDPEDDSA